MPTDPSPLTPEAARVEQGFVVAVDEVPEPLLGFLNADLRGPLQSNGKDSFTIGEAATQLLNNNLGWSGVLGNAFTVTYAYRDTAPATMPNGTGGFSRFNATQIDETELVLTAWSDVASITFVRVGSGNTGAAAYSDQATILLANYSTGASSSGGFAGMPATGAAALAASSTAGDVWINATLSTNPTPDMGNFGRMTLTHEIGHAIGLSHPGAYNSVGGGSATYASDAEYYEDSLQYTVMSYFSQTNTGGSAATPYPSAPMLDDIAAAQLLYGANLTTRLGDTVYGFNSTAGREWFAATSSATRLVFAVWDAGGNDTLDFSGYSQNATINLTEGAFSSVGGLTGNIAIAKGAVIENAIGGGGHDVIQGNAAANRLMGGAGSDQIFGREGQDFIRGEAGDDYLSGGSDFDDMHGNAGNDTLYGGDGDDWVVGGQGNDRLSGDGGGDIVLGNLGDDTCDGGTGDDIVRGGQGNDSVSGGAGDDFISGDMGMDTLTGGAGNDRFHLFAGSGADRVTDFKPGEDRVELLSGQRWTLQQVGADTVVYAGGIGAPDYLVLVGVKLNTLPAGWIFGY